MGDAPFSPFGCMCDLDVCCTADGLQGLQGIEVEGELVDGARERETVVAEEDLGEGEV